ncbi:MAG: DUF3422 domain-containing protein [Anderseniella sp.]|nr:DUF3422 domain-containing protein [Anderseniella sp.]
MIATGGQILPGDHPARMALNNEVHARPPEALSGRMRISYVVLFGELDMGPLRELCGKYGVEPPAEAANHFSADLGPFRLKWERHTEFTRYWFLVPATGGNSLFERTAIEAVPQGWLKTLKGEVLVANHIELMAAPRGKLDEEKLSRQHFGGNALVGSSVAGGLGRAFTDFRIHADGFGRMLVHDNGMTPRQRGRTVQRLLEIDTYRVLALLTLPVARELMPQLGKFEGELGEITTTMRTANEADEPKLLDRLTLLHADVVRHHTASQFRFAAAKAYSDLVALRISELREDRIEGLQLFAEFTDRRLAPAMRTCEAAAKRLDTVSERVSRATQMLSTRVDISREKQNQALLESMDRRARLQLRLQETVEGLSIAAITYYIVGLIGYLAKGLKEAGLMPVSDLVVTAASIPVVIALVALGVRRVRKSIME